MFAIGTRVIDRTANYGVFGNGATVVGTVVGLEELWFDGYEWQAEYVVEWDADTWSEYRVPEFRRCDELCELLAA